MRAKMWRIVVAVAIFLGASVADANTVTLDFESLTTPGTGYSGLGLSYTEQGFDFEAYPTGELYYYHSDDEHFAGSTGLFHMQMGGTSNTLLTQGDGLMFDLVSLDLSEIRPDASSASVVLVGTKGDSSTVSMSLTLDGVFGYETFALPGFTNLTELRLEDDIAMFQYDNITVSVIPEPTTVSLLALGLVLVRRRNNL